MAAISWIIRQIATGLRGGPGPGRGHALAQLGNRLWPGWNLLRGSAPGGQKARCLPDRQIVRKARRDKIGR